MTEESNQMQLHLGHGLPKMRMEPSRFPRNLKRNDRKSFDIINGQSEGASNQLVLYSPTTDVGEDVLTVSNPSQGYAYAGSFQSFSPSDTSRKVLPSVGQFTVQCAACFKWRFVPTKEKYEEIRQYILQEPFECARAREWRPDITCADPADIYQDGSRLWAIDKPSIAQPPPGWERLLRIRGQGSSKFADIYYDTPSGRKLRSMVEVERYLLEHPEYVRSGVNLTQFSFQIPKPLQEDYVRKRGSRAKKLCDGGSSVPLTLCEVKPISWACPPTREELELGGAGLSTPHFEPPVVDQPPNKKRAARRREELELGGAGLSTPYFEPPVVDQPPNKKRAKRPRAKTEAMPPVSGQEVINLE